MTEIRDLGVVRNRASASLKIGNMIFKGAGFNFQTAKKTASSYALKYFDPMYRGSIPAPLRGV
ncbi:hypothetical protein DAPPUDRAFT_259249 [Daphnia pulex]|uniref:Uncharacterized protein n=1 Tax=Daphnia pulex TaxID=6669 RepID=E9HGY1_DAPPU|nr:hypothetical protein DAPPUDRAFT_259249 [Daphnia pulex]|eukprot:EFX69000.1 hypothetical protein DAPPUDRAFT_259249 [Daphnia pulex]